MDGKTMTMAAMAAALALAGCQTRITATRNAETIATLNGRSVVLSGGWEFSARSPLWAAETLKGLTIDVGSGDNHVGVSLADYTRDLSTNSVAMVDVMATRAVELGSKVCAAIVSAGATPIADQVGALVKKFIGAGGDAANATVTCTDGSCAISDGSVTCSDGSCFETP